MSFDMLLQEIVRRADGRDRFVVALAGPPGAGKSTLAERLVTALKGLGEEAALLPMDGYHLDNAILEARGLLPRKGAPETFDVRGFADIVRAVRAGGEVFVPLFDRDREIAINAARVIRPQDRIIVAEGNYLLLNEAPWRELQPLFDLTILINPGIEELTRRLTERWVGYKLDAAGIEWKLYGNDLPNGKRIIENSSPADLVIDAI